jgi:hypothetical protein
VTIATNLESIERRTRSTPKSGDIFVMKMRSVGFLYGCVIEADIGDLARAPMPGAHLVYIYDRVSTSVDQSPELSPSDPLLLPPTFTNSLAWRLGFFKNVSFDPDVEALRLPECSFWNSAREVFVDDQGRQLHREVQPCGSWGLASYRRIDDLISDRLGVPRVA